MTATLCQCDQCGQSIDVPDGYCDFTIECRQCLVAVVVPRRKTGFQPPPASDQPPPLPRLEEVSSLRHRCQRHREVDATWHCDRCRCFACDDCARHFDEQDLTTAACACGGRLEAYRFESVEMQRQELRQGLAESFGFPIRGSGWAVLASSAVVWLLLVLLAGALRLPSAVLSVATLMGVCLLSALMINVIQRTVTAPKEELDWPEFSGVGELLLAALKLATTAVLYLAPGGILIASKLPWPVAVGGATLITSFWPMAVLAAAMVPGFDGLNPVRVVRSVLRVPRDQACVALWFFATCIVGKLVIWLVGYTYLLAILLGPAVMVYFVAVQGRLLGNLYRVNTRKLGWF